LNGCMVFKLQADARTWLYMCQVRSTAGSCSSHQHCRCEHRLDIYLSLSIYIYIHIYIYINIHICIHIYIYVYIYIYIYVCVFVCEYLDIYTICMYIVRHGQRDNNSTIMTTASLSFSCHRSLSHTLTLTQTHTHTHTHTHTNLFSPSLSHTHTHFTNFPGGSRPATDATTRVGYSTGVPRS
jgi:hypothetical protein